MPDSPTDALLGREREIGALESLLAQAAAVGPRIALLTGEPGVGKTRLLDSLAATAEAAGWQTLRGGAWDGGATPYLPFLEALGDHVRSADPELLRMQVGDVAAALAPLLPELAARLGRLPDAYPLPQEQARQRLFEAVGHLLTGIAGSAGVALLLDDMHAADTPSLDLLAHLARQLSARRGGAPVLIAAALRPGEVERPDALERALVELNRWRRLTRIEVGPLERAALTALAARALGAQLDAAATRLLWERSEGNPFFAEELVEGWRAAGALDRTPAGWTVTPEAAAATPPGLALAVRQRLARLAPEVREALRAAAVVGRQLDTQLLAEAAGLGEDEAEDLLRAAERAQLVRRARGGWLFAHLAIRAQHTGELAAGRRRQLHDAAARVLEARLDPADPRQLAALAGHLAAGSDRGRAALYAERAARSALSVAAPGEALVHYRTALELAGPQGPARGALLAGLGRAATLAGAEHEAAQALAEAQRWYERRHELEQAGLAAHARGQALARLEQHTEAAGAFGEALRLLPAGNARVEALLDLGGLLAQSLHRHADGMAAIDSASDLARRLEDDRLVAKAARVHGALLVRAGRLSEGVALLEQALDHARAADDPAEAAECCAALSMAHMWLGQLTRGAAYARERMAHAARTGDPYELRHTAVMQVVFDGMQGRLTQAEGLLALAAEQIEALASPEPRAFLAFVRGMVALYRGDDEQAVRLLVDAAEQFRAIGPGALIWYLGALAYARALQGERDLARADARELERLVEGVPPEAMPAAEPLAYLTATALTLGDSALAARYARRLAPFRGEYHDFLIDRLLGEVALREGDLTAAEALLNGAATVARAEEIPLELGHALAALAQIEQARGGRRGAARASVHLAEARAVLERAGAEGELRRLPEASGAPAGRQPLPYGLTAREAEVLALVARGMSNRAIAERLVLSEKTVVNHVASIFAKTGAENRAAATAIAIRQGLA